MPPSKRKSIMSEAERIQRLKESRIKYSQIGKAKTAPRIARPAFESKVQMKARLPDPPKPSQRPKPRSHVMSNNDADFEIDPNSMAMIKSGKITIPPVARPSFSGRGPFAGSSRPSMAGFVRHSITGRARPRASIAALPRESLMPLGINLFEANESQKLELSDYVNAQTNGNHQIVGIYNEESSSSFTPGRKNVNSVYANMANGPSSATRQRKIRFMENAIPEQRESVDAEEIVNSSAIHHNPIADASFIPSSILSCKKNKLKKKVTLESPLTATTSHNSSDSKSSEPSGISDEEVFFKMEKVAEKWFESEKSLGEDQKDRVRNLAKMLNEIADRMAVCEALNTTVSDNEPLPCIQGGSKLIKTPKAFKLFREQKTEVTAPPLMDIVKSILDTEDTPSPEEPENRKPMKNRRRSSRLSLLGGTADTRRRLFQRRSGRISGRHTKE